MAHFAKLDENNVVVEVVVIDNNAVNNLPFPDSEPIGVAFCQSLYGADTVWKQTSYNGTFRKRYAGEGLIYNSEVDAFISPKPYPSWSLDKEIGNWKPPVPFPNDEKLYRWDEESQTWIRTYATEIFGLGKPDTQTP